MYSLAFTSGTTGLPKGVMITHKNMLAGINAYPSSGYVYSEADIHFSYLPLAHLFERSVALLSYLYGVKVGFYHGVIPKLTDDMQALQPTVIPLVPRLLNRFYDTIQAKIKAMPNAEEVWAAVAARRKGTPFGEEPECLQVWPLQVR